MIWTDGLTDLLNNVIKNKRPSVGKRVKVIRGRKHAGKIGTVIWHGKDRFKYGEAMRYSDSYQAQLRDCMGMYGFRVGIRTDDGEKFFIDADNVEIIDANPDLPA